MYTLQRLAAMARCVEKRRSISCASIGRLSAIDAVSSANGQRRATPSTLLRIAAKTPGPGPAFSACRSGARTAECSLLKEGPQGLDDSLSLSLTLHQTGGAT